MSASTVLRMGIGQCMQEISHLNAETLTIANKKEALAKATPSSEEERTHIQAELAQCEARLGVRSIHSSVLLCLRVG